jgi:hypothetical protein
MQRLGDEGDFFVSKLSPELLQAGCEAVRHPRALRMQPGCDLNWYLIPKFLADHFAHHGAALVGSPCQSSISVGYLQCVLSRYSVPGMSRQIEQALAEISHQRIGRATLCSEQHQRA